MNPTVAPRYLGVCGELLYRLAGSPEEQLVELARVLQHQRIELCGDGEHGMEVFHIQHILLPPADPLLLLHRLALGAVAVAAGVVGLVGVPAIGADIAVASEGIGSAFHDRLGCLLGLQRGRNGFACMHQMMQGTHPVPQPWMKFLSRYSAQNCAESSSGDRVLLLSTSERCRYIVVEERLEWPSISLSVIRSVPLCRVCVEKLCLRVWGTRLLANVGIFRYLLEHRVKTSRVLCPRFRRVWKNVIVGIGRPVHFPIVAERLQAWTG